MPTLNIGNGFTAFKASPAGASTLAVIVVQEIYGVNREVRRVTQALAGKGFHAAAPDLFWRHAPSTTFDYSERDAARAVIGKLDPAQTVGDIVDAARALLADSGATQLAIVTLGWGGRFGLLAANKAGAAAVVAYYPGNLDAAEGLTAQVTAAQQYHFAGLDIRTPAALRSAVREGAVDRDDVEVYVYAQADHGFANHDRAEFNPVAAALADRRTAEFLELHANAGAPENASVA